MKICSIDPGTNQSALVCYDSISHKPLELMLEDNEDVLQYISFLSKCDDLEYLFVEVMESFGMPVGRSVFQTCEWIGMFILQWKMSGKRVYRIKRSEVKLSLCQTCRAKDSNIRQAIIDMYGGNRKDAIGTKHRKGPLYGIKKDIWSALAIAIVGMDKVNMQNQLEGNSHEEMDSVVSNKYDCVRLPSDEVSGN